MHLVEAEAPSPLALPSEGADRSITTWTGGDIPHLQLIDNTFQQSHNDMAEVAGLALGVVGVVGVIGAFKDAIDLFAAITAPRQFSCDYEVITTKLDIEKMMLLQWADRVRLLRGDYDRRLTDADTGMGIRRTLKLYSNAHG